MIDVEYAVESDQLFLGEYFESEARGEKIPESLLYVRQPIGELASLNFLVKKKLSSFRTEVERDPEVSFFLVEQPLGSSGFDLDVVARASQLRTKNRDSPYFLPTSLWHH